MSIGFFITDMVKTECLTYAFAGPIVPAIIWIVRAGGETFYLYVCAFLQALIFVFLWIFLNFILLMNNKYRAKLRHFFPGIHFVPCGGMYMEAPMHIEAHLLGVQKLLWHDRRLQVLVAQGSAAS